jgi:hypothetical protein
LRDDAWIGMWSWDKILPWNASHHLWSFGDPNPCETWGQHWGWHHLKVGTSRLAGNTRLCWLMRHNFFGSIVSDMDKMVLKVSATPKVKLFAWLATLNGVRSTLASECSSIPWTNYSTRSILSCLHSGHAKI